MYEAKILKHSVSNRRIELVTFEVNYPHAVHKDVMTHRWARNFQSFRAVPPEVLLDRLEAGQFFVPEVFGHRTKGMGQRNEPVDGQDAIDQKTARAIWEEHVQTSVARARRFLKMGIAKQQVNFLLQDLCFIRGIITTTLPQLENFFGLRLAVNDEGQLVARPEVHRIASLMYEAFATSSPRELSAGQWHLPLVTNYEAQWCWADNDPKEWEYWRKVSVGRCARISFLTHDGKRDHKADVALHHRLMHDGHMSPFEHQGTPIVLMPNAYLPDTEERMMRENTGSFGYGWVQYRKLIPGENNYYKLQQLRT